MAHGEVSTLQYFLCWAVLLTYLWGKPVKEGDIVIEKNEEYEDGTCKTKDQLKNLKLEKPESEG